MAVAIPCQVLVPHPNRLFSIINLFLHFQPTYPVLVLDSKGFGVHVTMFDRLLRLKEVADSFAWRVTELFVLLLQD